MKKPMRYFKQEWKEEFPWVELTKTKDAMLCTICTKHKRGIEQFREDSPYGSWIIKASHGMSGKSVYEQTSRDNEEETPIEKPA